MRMARKLGVITYRSALEWDGRFGRDAAGFEQAADDPFGLEFQVESYLEGHARRFVRFFDPNCYLYLSRSMDWFDLAEYVEERPVAGSAIDNARADARPASAKPQTGVSTADTVLAGLARIRIARALAIGANTDILFPVQQQEQIADGLRAGGADAHHRPGFAARPRRVPGRFRPVRPSGERLFAGLLSSLKLALRCRISADVAAIR